ncbi:MAG: Rab family GTPase [Thermoplasmata archaeon]
MGTDGGPGINEFMDWFLTEEEGDAPSPREPILMKKVCMLGDPAVGKTSLVARFVFSVFDDRYIETIGAKVVKRTMAVERVSTGERYRLKMIIWDIAGQRTLDFIKPTYYRDAEGAIVVADLTRRETLGNVPRWAESIRSVCGEIPIVLIVNKSDLKTHAQYTEAEAASVANGMGASLFMSSAKTGENVESAFGALGRALIQNTFARGMGAPSN